MGRHQATCRLRRIAPDVQLIEYRSPERSRLVFQGVKTCKAALCPLCAPKWARTRAEEITHAIDHWRAGPVLFLTLTLRHNLSMRLALLHRLLTAGFGSLWSGRRGQAFAALLGGKPESVRAHDRTCSVENGWHPHIHSMLFMQGDIEVTDDLKWAIYDRWCDALETVLRRFVRFVHKIIEGTGCGKQGCLACQLGRIDECSHLRDRARHVLGSKMFPRNERLTESARRALDDLKSFCDPKKLRELDGYYPSSQPQPGITVPGAAVPRPKPTGKTYQKELVSLMLDRVLPRFRYGVDIEPVRSNDRAPDYLAKLGLELAFRDKLGKTGSDGIVRYGLWEVAALCTRHGDPRRKVMRRNWKELYQATRATQTITFSSREALGLGPDPYADEAEPPEQEPGELRRIIGEIAGREWDEYTRFTHHGALVSLLAAHQAGIVDDLPLVTRWDGAHALWTSTGPPERGPPKRSWWGQIVEAEPAAQRRGAAVVRAAWEKLKPKPEVDSSLWREEVVQRIDEACGVIRIRGCKVGLRPLS